MTALNGFNIITTTLLLLSCMLVTLYVIIISTNGYTATKKSREIIANGLAWKQMYIQLVKKSLGSKFHIKFQIFE